MGDMSSAAAQHDEGADALGPQLPPGRRLELPGRGTTFIRDLEGPPGAPALVLLHGLSATADLNWFPSFFPLGRHFRVVAIDHRGHGRGIRSARRFRLSDCADDVAAMADVLGIDRFIPVGYSMGGPIAQLLWKRYADRVAGLVLCATSRNFGGRPPERAFFSMLPFLSAAARMTPAPVWRGVTGRVLARRDDDPPLRQWVIAEMRHTDPRAVIEAAHAIGRFSSHEWAGEIDVPTAVVVTARDRLVPPSRQLKLAHAIPGATVHPVHGDHGACVVDAHRFVPVLVDACRSVASRSITGRSVTGRSVTERARQD